MSSPLKSFLLLGLMLVTAILALVLSPAQRVADQSPSVDLRVIVPLQFGEWREVPESAAQVIDPQQKEVIDRIYKQTLSRVYVNGRGERVMLSLAYGEDQRDSVQLHFPEVCYPAQGFQVLSTEKGVLDTGFGSIRIKRLMTAAGDRFEPVTYWTLIGERVVQGGVDTKLAQMAYGLKGHIPSGLLFRVSSISSDPAIGYVRNEAFVRELIASLSPAGRLQLIGAPEERVIQ